MSSNQGLEPGHGTRLGSTWDGQGVNFALFSAHAEKVELCLFSEDGHRELERHELPTQTDQIWHGYLPGAGPGTLYGYRVYGPYQPDLGHRFNHHKLLLDPYARQLAGELRWSPSNYGYDVQSKKEDLSFDIRNNAPFVPKCRVVAESGPDRSPEFSIPRNTAIIYETHVKGFTINHPDLPEELRGTFRGLGHEKIIDYLKALGITSIELMPVHHFISEHFLEEKGLLNYWGYNTLAFFAPHAGYLQGDEIDEFREMVDRLHDAGIEVILDVVFNHTAEGNRLGPTLSLRGIDNLSYYRLQAENKRFYINDTGCGNTLNLSHPQVIRLVMDSLRYWTTKMHVDGFRFDLGTVMGRETHGYDKGSGFFDAINQDPALMDVKLIAEPWDIGPGGYQLGNFPTRWSEWNDQYRDTIRRFWRGDPGVLPDFARRIHGSSDIFEHSGRRPSASINFVASHDGFTLNDLVSFRDRHNEMNQENNRDGHNENYSENYGVEGPTLFFEVNEIRVRQRKNFLATLMVSQGTPMLAAGDEFGRTQKGNNNAYCQDNDISWVTWTGWKDDERELLEFTRYLISLKHRYPELAQDHYVHQPLNPGDPAILWYGPDGMEMHGPVWGQRSLKTLGYLLSLPRNDQGITRQFLVAFHAGSLPTTFTLPKLETATDWRLLLDTNLPDGKPSGDDQVAGAYMLTSYSTIILLSENNPAATGGELFQQ